MGYDESQIAHSTDCSWKRLMIQSPTPLMKGKLRKVQEFNVQFKSW